MSITIIALSAGQVAADILVQDALGNQVRLSRPAERIISLAPHTTENLFAAGAGSRLVGAAQFSDHPPAAKRIPRVGGHAGLDLESITALNPDLIVAWAGGNRREDIERLRMLGFEIYLSEPRQLVDIALEIEALGKLAGTTPAARRSAERFRNRLQQLRQQYAGHEPLRVFYEIWPRPLMTVNGEQLISKALTLCGGRNIFAQLPALAPSIDIEAVLAANPDVIVTAAGSDQRHLQWTDKWRRWRQLAAVARDNLYSVSPDLLQRQGPRILQGITQLCEAIARARRKTERPPPGTAAP